MKCYSCNHYDSTHTCKICNNNICDHNICLDFQDRNRCHQCYEKLMQEEIQKQLKNEELVQCENCGLIWDGYAQCHCGQEPDLYVSSSSDLDTDTESIDNDAEPPKKRSKN